MRSPIAAASNGGGASTAVVAMSAERSTTIRPPTCDERQRAQPALVVAELHRLGDAARVGADVAVGDRDRLRRAGRARRVHDERDVVALGRVRQLEDAGVAAHRPLDADLDLAQDRGALARGQPRVDRHGGRAEQQAAVERLDERQARLERERDRLAAAHAAHVQRARRADGAQRAARGR